MAVDTEPLPSTSQHAPAAPTHHLLDRPQILVHIEKSLTYTPHAVQWLPGSARLIAFGQQARGNGIMEVMEMRDGRSLEIVSSSEQVQAIKCATFGAASWQRRRVATGGFEGRLAIWDVERLDSPTFSVLKAHKSIINCIDGTGGTGLHNGAPEIVTGSRDGCVKVWDPRQKEVPVATIAPAEGETPRDCWSVCFGDSYNDEERAVCAGYDNGDVKLFDLRNMSLRWETNVKNGVCSLEFDRRDIQMNKLVVVGLESMLKVYDLRTQHPKEGFACASVERLPTAGVATTNWCVRHLPQNRDIFMVCGGTGGLQLYKYNYPSTGRVRRVDPKEPGSSPELFGVAGTVELLNETVVAPQPVGAFDWHADKRGLCAYVSYDQTLRVSVVTRLNL